jgi:WD40 repeat protein
LTSDVAGWVRMFDFRPEAVVVETLGLQPYQRNATAVAFHPNSDTFAVAGKFVTNEALERENDIILYDFATVARTAYLAGHTADVTALTYRLDGALLVSGGLDNTVRIWDVTTGNEMATFAQTAGVMDIAFSPDQSMLAVALTDGTVALWSVATQSQIGTLTGHFGRVDGVAYSPDGTVIATIGAEDGSLRLWDSATAQPLASFQVGEIAPVPLGGVAFSPDGTLIATGGDDRTIRLWAVATSVG